MKYKSNANEKLLIEQYLEKIRPQLASIIDDLRSLGSWKFHLTMKIDFMSSKVCNGKRLMHCKSYGTEIMIGNDTSEITEELFQSLLQRYQIG